MNIVEIPSPHHSSGRKKYRPEAIVIHIMEGSLAGTDSWFRDPQSKVSAHYGVGSNGAVHRYVAESNTAWHAGRINAPSWPLIKRSGTGQFVNPNLYTIGIEHEGREDTEWSEAMYQSSAALIRDICSRWGIPVDRRHIVGHHEIYSLKTCPGHKVNLSRLILLAGGAAPAVAGNQDVHIEKVPETGTVRTRSRMRMRPMPSTELPQLKTIDAGVALNYAGYTTNGESINGNSKWFYTDEEHWFWSGAVDDGPGGGSGGGTDSLAVPKPAEGGPTLTQIMAATGAKAANAQRFAPFLQDTCLRYGINTPARMLCFLSQIGHESGGLFFTEELASGRQYEHRANLGNTMPGDGVKFKGRGLIQITGRSNYQQLSRDLDTDLITDPKKLGGKNATLCTPEQLRLAALSAGWFWDKRGLNAIADGIDIRQPITSGTNLKQYKRITRLINGGFNGLQDRINKYQSGVTAFVTREQLAGNLQV